MDVLDSIEARWFVATDHFAVSALKVWFAEVEAEGLRLDNYLLTETDSLGFKERVQEGMTNKLEAKYLMGSLGRVQLAPQVAGRLERWRKLSIAAVDVELRKDGVWRSVSKVRRLKKFAYENGQVLEVAPAAHPQSGCGVELTELTWTVSDRSVNEWTFGLEAFGPAGTLLDVFVATSRVALAQCAELVLSVQSSRSYPEWLLSAAPPLPTG